MGNQGLKAFNFQENKKNKKTIWRVKGGRTPPEYVTKIWVNNVSDPFNSLR
jgi:hypothetical protein